MEKYHYLLQNFTIYGNYFNIFPLKTGGVLLLGRGLQLGWIRYVLFVTELLACTLQWLDFESPLFKRSWITSLIIEIFECHKKCPNAYFIKYSSIPFPTWVFDIRVRIQVLEYLYHLYCTALSVFVLYRSEPSQQYFRVLLGIDLDLDVALTLTFFKVMFCVLNMIDRCQFMVQKIVTD